MISFADTVRLEGGTIHLVDGGFDNDSLIGGAGADAFFGGAGDDAAVYFATVKVNLANTANGTGDAKGDTFAGVEGLVFLGAG